MAQQMNLFIRPAMASDAPEIHHIVQLAFAEYASLLGLGPVSYTHLDVYKRQGQT